MNFSEIDRKLIQAIDLNLREKGLTLAPEEVPAFIGRIKNDILTWYVSQLIHQAETVLEIDPHLSEGEILRSLARSVVQFLGADFASIRVYGGGREGAAVFPDSSLPGEEAPDLTHFDKEVASEVLRTRQSLQIPNLSKAPQFRAKEKARQMGIHSLLAVPISLPRFSLKDADSQGVIQIFYRQEDKAFTPLEIQVAEMLSRRVGHVIARKRILSLQKINLTRDRILEEIYLRLARREGIKMRDVFNHVIPALADIMKIQRCTLFSVMEDREHVILEAGFPETEHGIGKIFSVQEPYIKALVHPQAPFGDFRTEKIHPAYILINDPQASRLLPPPLKHYLATQEINCVLYVPLYVDGMVQYFLAFDAQAQHRQFAEEEIQMFALLGKELMKGLRLEKMDDILHDFKNPAIAIAGFAKRVHRILEGAPDRPWREKIGGALEIMLEESSRIQELALTLHGEGRETVLDLGALLKKRFMINREAMRELGRRDIRTVEETPGAPLYIRCYRLHMERVLDNLLNNASQATPAGGELGARCFPDSTWATVEIFNTGEMTPEERERCLLGQGRGRGLHITTRLVKHMGGRMEIDSAQGRTTFRVELPLAGPQSSYL